MCATNETDCESWVVTDRCNGGVIGEYRDHELLNKFNAVLYRIETRKEFFDRLQGRQS